MIHRLYIGTGDTSTVRRIVARYVEGATVWSATGIWRGESELSTVVEIIGADNRPYHHIRNLATELRKAFDQESVLWVWHEIEYDLI